MNFNHVMWLVPDDKNYVYTSYIDAMRAMGVSASLLNYKQEVTRLGITAFEQYFLSELSSRDVDLVIVSFYGRSFGITPRFLKDMSSLTRTAVLAGDDEVYSTQQTVYFAQAVDAVISTDAAACSLYEQIGCPSIYFPFPSLDDDIDDAGVEKEIDVSFVGDCTRKDRKRYIEYLKSKGIRVEVYGAGSKNGYVNRPEMINIFKKSRINLNFTQLPFESEMYRKEPWRSNLRQVKGRPFEVANAKAFCLSEYAPALSRNFEVGKEIDTFYDEHDLYEKIDYYLKNDSEREQLAANAYARVRKEYTPRQLIDKLFSSLPSLENSRLKQNRSIYLGHDFNVKRAHDDLIFAVSILAKGHFYNAAEVFFAIPIMKTGSFWGLARGVGYLIRRALFGSLRFRESK